MNKEKIGLMEKAIKNFKDGKMLIVVDDEDRENEGDFIISAEKVTPEDINFMMKYGRGLICTSITNDRANKLKLSPMVKDNTEHQKTNFTVSVDAKENITTGISSKDRWVTTQVLLDEGSCSEDLVRPGHMFPLIAKDGGVLQRAGHTEACVDLAKLAQHSPMGLLVEIVDEDGSMARMDRLKEIAEEHSLLIISIADLIEYRRKKEKLVSEVVDIPLPTKFGEFRMKLFEDKIHGDHHIALVKGKIESNSEPLVRVHSQCLTGDIFASLRCDCGPQLVSALDKISNCESGVLVYLRQEGRGIGLKNKILAYQLQDEGFDTVEANEKLGFSSDLREYGIGAQILKECGVTKMKLLTNNPKKIIGLEGYNLRVVGREAIEIKSNDANEKYLKTKRDKLGHLLSFLDD
ncbi:MAG: bifunctional 3,4-dihydroxy-2-butanone-4-phosphate synthase/GTP cyclohydrolase II [Candidatus Marinimicrobia bacterium]|nr:bifunctional 3,4-dihydroxy-2-butanone-4-phosphate synthase/GTP cyclohydrolase II [Candidatus Neomarinimicrobiota bacterium]|tara:strand:+ start:1150 stop:2367 length:1218 start_codon:yes stop_codon:yes gene_type:complete